MRAASSPRTFRPSTAARRSRTSRSSAASENELSGAVGFKFNPRGRLLIDANVLFGLDDHGLRDSVTPLVGFEYGF